MPNGKGWQRFLWRPPMSSTTFAIRFSQNPVTSPPLPRYGKGYDSGYGVAIAFAKPLPSLLSRHPLPKPTFADQFSLTPLPSPTFTTRLSHTPLPFMVKVATPTYGIGLLWNFLKVKRLFRKWTGGPSAYLHCYIPIMSHPSRFPQVRRESESMFSRTLDDSFEFWFLSNIRCSLYATSYFLFT